MGIFATLLVVGSTVFSERHSTYLRQASKAAAAVLLLLHRHDLTEVPAAAAARDGSECSLLPASSSARNAQPNMEPAAALLP